MTRRDPGTSECMSGGTELQEWKSTRVVHAGPWVRPPYKGIVEAEDCRTSPAHAHVYVGVRSYMCACV